jgi:hypothetical protein
MRLWKRVRESARSTWIVNRSLYRGFMSGFGDTSKLQQRGLRSRIGQIIIDLNHPMLISVSVTHHDQHLRLVLLTPVGSRCHAALHHLHHQGPLGPIAHVNPAPGLRF